MERRLELVTDYPITCCKLVRVGLCDFVPTVAVIDKNNTLYMDTEEWKFIADQVPRMLSLLQSRPKKVEVQDRVGCKNIYCIFSKKGRNRIMKIEQVVICFATSSPPALQLNSPSVCFNKNNVSKLCRDIKKINDSLDLITKMADLYKKNEECQLFEPVNSVPIDLGFNTNTLFYNLKELHDICNDS